MTTKKLSAVTNELIETSGNTAKNVINAYRVGNERAVSYLDQSFATAVKKTSTRLSAEVRGNALLAQKKVSALYAQGVTLTSDGADVAVNKAVELAEKGVEQVAVGATRFEKATGVSALHTLAEAAVPAAEAAIKVAAKLEEQSSALANKIAGSKAKVKVAAVKRTVEKKAATVAKKTTSAAKSVKKTASKVAAQATEAVAQATAA